MLLLGPVGICRRCHGKYGQSKVFLLICFKFIVESILRGTRFFRIVRRNFMQQTTTSRPSLKPQRGWNLSSPLLLLVCDRQLSNRGPRKQLQLFSTTSVHPSENSSGNSCKSNSFDYTITNGKLINITR